jgi:hypothetical protein
MILRGASGEGVSPFTTVRPYGPKYDVWLGDSSEG